MSSDGGNKNENTKHENLMTTGRKREQRKEDRQL